tara:strand:- start:147 stop:278 length:132 start_codon:yes stop_codon:yes gene_type:complete
MEHGFWVNDAWKSLFLRVFGFASEQDLKKRARGFALRMDSMFF